MQAVTGEPPLLVRKVTLLVAAGLALALGVSIPHLSTRQWTTTMWRKPRALGMGEASASGELPCDRVTHTASQPSLSPSASTGIGGHGRTATPPAGSSERAPPTVAPEPSSLSSYDLPFAVIYYTSINPSHPWKDLLTLQMAELITFGIAPRALSIHVELSTDEDVFSPLNSKNEAKNVLHSAADLVHDLLPAAKVTLRNNNTFEYPGIHRLWEVASRHQRLPRSTILLYFHGKGMWNGEHTVIRSEENKRLTRES